MKRFRTTLAIAALAFCVSLPAMAKEGRASGESCVSSYARCSQRCTTNVGGDPVDGHEADIVPVAGIARAGIAEAGEDQHGGTPAGLPIHSKTAGAGPAVS